VAERLLDACSRSASVCQPLGGAMPQIVQADVYKAYCSAGALPIDPEPLVPHRGRNRRVYPWPETRVDPCHGLTVVRLCARYPEAVGVRA
jgi:hypothetical protein